MKTIYHPSPTAAVIKTRTIGSKAYYLEPWLILGSFLFWLLVLPFAGLVWSGTALARFRHAGHP
jgi:4-amino-4-deoxy-L-arabinose transferase-like glycosyltransferase